MDVHLEAYTEKGNFIETPFTSLTFFKVKYYISGLMFSRIIYFSVCLFLQYIN
jgi:hypothetical protein